MREKKRIKDLMNKAREFLNASKLLLDNGFYDSAVSRAYYTMFSVARALLLTKGIKAKTHRGIIAKFSQEFVKAGVFPEEMATMLAISESLRERGDYFPTPNTIPKEKAEETVKYAEEFIEIAERYMEMWEEKQRRTEEKLEKEEEMEIGG